MYKLGKNHKIINIDYSRIVIEQMLKKAPELEWIVMDMRNILFRQNSFDLIIDKGSIDALWSNDDNPWDIPPCVEKDIIATLDGIGRTLTKSGTFVSLSFGQSHFRLPLYSKSDLVLKLTATKDVKMHYLYEFTLRF